MYARNACCFKRMALHMKRTPILHLLIGIAVMISLATNWLLLWRCVDAYRENAEMRLNPGNVLQFEAANLSLAESNGDQVRIVFLGDSRIAQWTGLPVVPGSLSINRGVSGETTAQVLQRLQRDVFDIRADVVVVQVGINDLKLLGLFPSMASDIVRRCRENIEQIVRAISDRGISVIVMTILPAGEIEYSRRLIWSETTRASIARINRWLLEDTRDGFTVINCDPGIADGDRLKAEYARDSLHLNASGYAVLESLLLPILTDCVARHRTRD